jgi:protein-disulfide isomerase
MERLSRIVIAALGVAVLAASPGCIGKRRPVQKQEAHSGQAKAAGAKGKLLGPEDVDDKLSEMITGERVAVAYGPEDPYRGAEQPLVTIVEYSDFQCPFCSRLATTMDQLLEEYPEDVRLVFKQYPLPMHKDAEPAARAALAAHEQGKFWPMHDLLFQNQRALEGPQLVEYAKQLQLDLDAFTKRLDAEEIKQRVKADLEEGQRVKVRGTPSFYVNGKFQSGAKKLEDLKAIVDEERKLALELMEAGSKREEIYARILKASEAPPPPAEKKDDAPKVDPNFKRGDAVASMNYGIPTGDKRPSRGPDDALVTIIEFGSLVSPDSKKNERVLRAVRSKHPDVRFVYRHLPGDDPKALGAARAALAASAAGDEAFWKMHDKILATDEDLNQQLIFNMVQELGLDLDAFKRALGDAKLLVQLREDKVIAETFHGSAEAPLFWVNGRVLQGTPSLADFEALVIEERKKAEKLVEEKGLEKGPGVYEEMRKTWRGAEMAATALAKAGL